MTTYLRHECICKGHTNFILFRYRTILSNKESTRFTGTTLVYRYKYAVNYNSAIKMAATKFSMIAVYLTPLCAIIIVSFT